MIYRIPLLLLFSLIMISTAFAQGDIGPMQLDPFFGVNGVRTVSFPGTTEDSVTCAIVFSRPSADHQGIPVRSPIIIAGKLRTATVGEVRFGITRMDSAGVMANTFGSNGLANLSWNSQPAVDYPTSIFMRSDSALLFSGASSAATDIGGIRPSIFKLKNNGTPDSTFGTHGRLIVTDSLVSRGEFTTIDTMYDLVANASRMIAMGYSDSTANGGHRGFYAFRSDPNGVPDPLFGISGKQILPAPIRDGKGFLTYDRRLLFVGRDTSTHPELILARLMTDGTIDLSFGVNGVWHTGIRLNGTDRSFQAVYALSGADTALFVAGRFEDTASVMIVRFERDRAAIAKNFGTDGFAVLPIVAHMRVRGLTISNDGSIILAGVSDTGISRPFAAKFFNVGYVDSSFGNDGFVGVPGTQLLDVRNPAEFNIFNSYSVRSNPRLVGVGTATIDGHSAFLAARYTRVDPPKIAPDTLDFGIVDTGTTRSLSIQVTDTLDQAISIRAFLVNPPGPFVADPATLRLDLAPGESRSIKVLYSPHSITVDSAILNIFLPGGNAQRVVLRGEGHAGTSDVRSDGPSPSMIRIVINIAQDAFTIINASPEMATLKLYDAAGRLADPGWSIASGSSRTIGVLSVPSGIYYLNGWFGSRWVTQKIVIWH